MPHFSVLFVAAIVLAGLHMIAPDHWVPITVVSGSLNYSSGKKNTIAAGIGVLHAFTSMAVAGVALLIGFLLVRSYFGYVEVASILLLVGVGIYFIVNGYLEEEEDLRSASLSVKSILAVSAFPDFALIPIMLAASSLSGLQILAILTAFTLVSTLSLTLMVYGTSRGLSKALETVPPKYIDYIMGIILFATAAFLEFIPF